jgi:hypothetical protein
MLADLSRNDLITFKPELVHLAGIPYAGVLEPD